MKVLIAEDDTHIRNGLCDLLETEGYTVVLAADGEQAWELLETEKPGFCALGYHDASSGRLSSVSRYSSTLS